MQTVSFSQKIDFDILYKLSRKERICKNVKSILRKKIKKNIIKLSSTEFVNKGKFRIKELTI